jgi:hypothetical protein
MLLLHDVDCETPAVVQPVAHDRQVAAVASVRGAGAYVSLVHASGAVPVQRKPAATCESQASDPVAPPVL